LKSQKKQDYSLRNRLREAAEQMDLPAGMLAGQPQLTLDGDLQLLIERHLGIVEYGTERILIASKKFTIEVKGTRMYLIAMDEDSVRIRGQITSVSYCYGA